MCRRITDDDIRKCIASLDNYAQISREDLKRELKVVVRRLSFLCLFMFKPSTFWLLKELDIDFPDAGDPKHYLAYANCAVKQEGGTVSVLYAWKDCEGIDSPRAGSLFRTDGILLPLQWRRKSEGRTFSTTIPEKLREAGEKVSKAYEMNYYLDLGSVFQDRIDLSTVSLFKNWESGWAIIAASFQRLRNPAERTGLGSNIFASAAKCKNREQLKRGEEVFRGVETLPQKLALGAGFGCEFFNYFPKAKLKPHKLRQDAEELFNTNLSLEHFEGMKWVRDEDIFNLYNNASERRSVQIKFPEIMLIELKQRSTVEESLAQIIYPEWGIRLRLAVKKHMKSILMLFLILLLVGAGYLGYAYWYVPHNYSVLAERVNKHEADIGDNLKLSDPSLLLNELNKLEREYEELRTYRQKHNLSTEPKLTVIREGENRIETTRKFVTKLVAIVLPEGIESFSGWLEYLNAKKMDETEYKYFRNNVTWFARVGSSLAGSKMIPNHFKLTVTEILKSYSGLRELYFTDDKLKNLLGGMVSVERKALPDKCKEVAVAYNTLIGFKTDRAETVDGEFIILVKAQTDKRLFDFVNKEIAAKFERICGAKRVYEPDIRFLEKALLIIDGIGELSERYTTEIASLRGRIQEKLVTYKKGLQEKREVEAQTLSSEQLIAGGDGDKLHSEPVTVREVHEAEVSRRRDFARNYPQQAPENYGNEARAEEVSAKLEEICREEFRNYAATTQNTADLRELMAEGDKLLNEAREYAAAKEKFEQILIRDPGNSTAVYGLGLAQFYLQDYRCADNLCYVLEQKGKTEEACQLRGLVLYEQEEYAQAFEYLNRAANIYKMPLAMQYLALLYMEVDWEGYDPVAGNTLIKRSLEMGNVKAYITLGWMYHNGIFYKVDHDKAVECYKLAAAAGEPMAWNNLGCFYLYGSVSDKIEKDYKFAQECFEYAAKKEKARGYYNLGYMYQYGYIGQRVDTATAIEKYDKAIALRSSDALNMKGRLLLEDHAEIKRDIPAALACLEAASSQGQGGASYKLGEIYEFGLGDEIEADKELSDKYYKKALNRWKKQSEQSAYYFESLGDMYRWGKGVEVDYAQAFRYYAQAVKNNARIFYILGEMYANGWGTAKDPVLAEKSYRGAVKRYRQDAANGAEDGICNLAYMYETGKGVDRVDAEEACRLYEVAADKGSARGQYALGWMYEHGKGVEVDKEVAKNWYEQAAEQGHATALNNLGWLCELGVGEPGGKKNISKAIAFYQQACRHNEKYAFKNLARLSAQGDGLTRDQEAADRLYRRAFELFEDEAEGGNADAMYTVGWMYENGKGVDLNITQAVRWYKSAAEQDNTDALFRLGLLYATGRDVARNYAEALKYYQRAADKGEAAAMNNLGLLYENGTGTPEGEKDIGKAIGWYEAACVGNEKYAYKNLARLSENGIGVLRDQEKAGELYLRAFELFAEKAEEGDVDAMYTLGWLYRYGKGGEPDIEQAVRWYERAAELGNAAASLDLGCMYDNGEGVGQDYVKAFEYYQRAVEKGSAVAMNNLGWLYERGVGVPEGRKDIYKAIGYYEAAAEAAESYALKNLARLSENGIGVMQDSEKAGELYRRALAAFKREAESGDVAAMRIVGDMYREGRGVDSDKAEASKWYERVAESNNAAQLNDLGKMYYDGKICKQDYAKAVEYLKRAADLGNDTSKANLAICYLHGRGTVKDVEAAIQLLEEGVKREDYTAQRILGWELLLGERIARDRVRGKRLLEVAAAAGETRAMYFLYLYYKHDKLGFKDENRDESNVLAAKWLEQAAANGLPEAAYELAMKHFFAEDGEEHKPKAFALVKQAAEAGYTEAQTQLGYMYEQGYGVELDMAAAAEWYKAAAANADMCAQVHLAMLYERGAGVAKDEEKAFRLYQEAAESGYPPGEYYLAMAYYKGVGTEKDKERAFNMFDRLDYLPAYQQLARMYYAGEGCTQSMGEARKNYQIAVLALTADVNYYHDTGAYAFYDECNQNTLDKLELSLGLEGYERADFKDHYNKHEYDKVNSCFEKYKGIAYTDIHDVYDYYDKIAFELLGYQLFANDTGDSSDGVPIYPACIDGKLMIVSSTDKIIFDNTSRSFMFLNFFAEHNSPEDKGRIQNILGEIYGGVGEFSELDGIKDTEKALYWFNKAVENNSIDAMRHLCVYYLTSEGGEKDIDKARKMLMRAKIICQANEWKYRDAELSVYSDILIKRRELELDSAEVEKIIEEMSLSNNSALQVALGLFYLNFDKNKILEYKSELAWQYFERAAERGNRGAVYFQGKMYEEGRWVEQDYAKAYDYFSRSAALGYYPAYYEIGELYRKGLSVEKDLEIALENYERAAKHGVAEACYRLGEMYRKGEGVGEDKKKATMYYMQALMYYKQALSLGDMNNSEVSYVLEVIFNLAVFSFNGDIGERDVKHAVIGFKIAAQEGHEEAQKLLPYLSNMEVLQKGRIELHAVTDSAGNVREEAEVILIN